MAKMLDDGQLAELLKEMGRADSVEMKLTVPDSGFRSAVDSLDLDPLEARLRQVIFFDTPELTLYSNGVVVRSRRIQGRSAQHARAHPIRPETPCRWPSVPGSMYA